MAASNSITSAGVRGQADTADNLMFDSWEACEPSKAKLQEMESREPMNEESNQSWDDALANPLTKDRWDSAEKDAIAEKQDIAKAIANSLRDESSQDSTANDHGVVDTIQNEKKFKKQPGNSISDMVDNLALRISNEFTPINDQYGDTLIYIGSPSKTNDQSHEDFLQIKKHFDRFYRIHSNKLKALNSERFNKCLGPNACIFAERRLKKLDAYKKLDQKVKDSTKYHIDLRPPNEDEEAVVLLLELSCSPGIRSWHLAQKKYDIPKNLVFGTDHLDTESNPYCSSNSRKAPDEDDLSGETPEKDLQDPRMIAEYSALRHHSALERILHAIHGDDPKLDSAPKMWTFFATAKYFNCATHPSISKWIFSWLTSGGNRNFIQNNPEVAYRIGLGIEDAGLMKDAFSILVGEKALIDICREKNGMILPSSVSVHGRRQENLDDDEQNRVSHAASSLVHRITSIYQSVVLDLDWIYISPEYQKLLDAKGFSFTEDKIIQNAKDLLQGFVKGRFIEMLRMDLASPFNELDLKARNTAPFRHGTELAFDITYSELHQEARPFTRSFWIALSRARFYEGLDHRDLSHIDELKYVDTESDHEAIKLIKRSYIDHAILNVNKILISRTIGKGFGPDHTQSRDIDHTAISPIMQSHLQPMLPKPFVPPIDSPKRMIHDRDAFPEAVEKCRKTSGDNAEALTLPYRFADPNVTGAPISSGEFKDHATNPLLSFFIEDTLARTDKTEASSETQPRDSSKKGMFAMEDVANEQASSSPRPIERHQTTNPPPAAQQHLNSRPTENGMVTSDVPESDSHVREYDAHVRDYFAQSGQSAVQRGSVDEPNTPPRKSEDGDEIINDPSSSLYQVDPSWRYDQSTRTWMVPSKQQDSPQVTQRDDIGREQFPHQSLEHQPRIPRPTPVQSGWRPVQQFSNTNTPMPGNNEWSPQQNYPNNHTSAARGLGPGSKPRLKPWNANEPMARAQHYPINPHRLLEEFSKALHKVCDELVHAAHLFHGTERLPVDLIDNLMDLGESEIKFLPLWCGGFDDGTGGVFDDMDVPNLEAGGFKGGKRGISNVNGLNDEGSVNGSESSFDDIASEAGSTVGKASKAATEGGNLTVRSLSDTESDGGFVNLDDVFEDIQLLKMEQIRKGEMREVDSGPVFDDDGDDSTIMGAGSDVQGNMFGDMDDDDDDEEEEDEDEDEEDKDNDKNRSSFEEETLNEQKLDIKGKGKAKEIESDDDMDFEMI